MINFARVTFAAIMYGLSKLTTGAGTTFLIVYALTVFYPNDVAPELRVFADLAPIALSMAGYFAVVAFLVFLLHHKQTKKDRKHGRVRF